MSNVIAVIALVVAGLALLVSIFAARYTYRNAVAAERQAAAAERSLPSPVEWESEFGSMHGNVRLRNIGTEDAHDVRIEFSERRYRVLDNQLRQRPRDVALDVQAGQSIELEIDATGGIQDIREIPVLLAWAREGGARTDAAKAVSPVKDLTPTRISSLSGMNWQKKGRLIDAMVPSGFKTSYLR